MFYETTQEGVARILAELEYVQSRACGTLRYALGRYAWLTAFVNAARAANLTLVVSLLLNLNFVLARPVFKISSSRAPPIKFYCYAGLALKARGCDAKRGKILFWA